MATAFPEGLPIVTIQARINGARRSLEILTKVEGQPWPALPRVSPGYRIGRRLADEVVDLTICLWKGKERKND